MNIKSRVDSAISAVSAIIGKANAKTGASDTTLNGAVTRLINGYGQGGGSGSVQYAEGAIQTGQREITNLGFVPDFFGIIIQPNGMTSYKDDPQLMVDFRRLPTTAKASGISVERDVKLSPPDDDSMVVFVTVYISRNGDHPVYSGSGFDPEYFGETSYGSVKWRAWKL